MKKLSLLFAIISLSLTLLLAGCGGATADKKSDTKSEAVKIAREISKNQGSELFIHGRDGKIQSRDSHGNDPHPPKG